MATVTYWVNCSALGDAICCIPVVKALIAEGKLYKALIPKKFCELFWVCDVDRKYIFNLDAPKWLRLNTNNCLLERCPPHKRHTSIAITHPLFKSFPLMIRPIAITGPPLGVWGIPIYKFVKEYNRP